MALATLTTRIVPNLTEIDLATLDQVAVGRCKLRKNLPPRLRKAGYHSLGDVARVSAGTLLRVRKIGPGSIIVLQERILAILNRPILPGRPASAAMPASLRRERARILPYLSPAERHKLAATPITRLALDVWVVRAIAPLRCLMAIELADLTVSRVMDLYRATTDLPHLIRTALRAALGPHVPAVEPETIEPAPAASMPSEAPPASTGGRNTIPFVVKVQIEEADVATLPGLTATARRILREAGLQTLAQVAQHSQTALASRLDAETMTVLKDLITSHYRAAVARYPHVALKPFQYVGFAEWLQPETRSIPRVDPAAPLLVLRDEERALLVTYPWRIASLGLPHGLKTVPGAETRTLADLADETVTDLLALPGFNDQAIDRTMALLRHILSTGVPYRERPAPIRTAEPPSEKPVALVQEARRNETPAASPMASRPMATAPVRKGPILEITDEERSWLATYPTMQTGTGVDAFLQSLRRRGDTTLAQVAARDEADLQGIQRITDYQISRLRAYLKEVIGRKAPFVGIRPLPPRLRARLAAIPLRSLAIPETVSRDLARLGFATLAHLVRRPLADAKRIHPEMEWIETVRMVVATAYALCQLSPGERIRLDARADSGFLQWVSAAVPAVTEDPRDDVVPRCVKPYLTQHLLTACGLADDKVETLRHHRMKTLAEVAEIPSVYIAHLVGENDVARLRGWISAYFVRVAQRETPGTHRRPTDRFLDWILPASVPLPALTLSGPLVALTSAQRTILASYPQSVLTENLRIEARPLTERGIRTLADLADQDTLDLLTLPGFWDHRIARIADKLREIADRGRPYQKPVLRHAIPMPMVRALAKISLDEFTIPAEAQAWLSENGCDSLVEVTKIPVGRLLHLPQAATWIAEIRREVAYVRWSLALDPFDDERADAHLYDSFLGWIDPTVEKPVPTPVPLMTVTDPDLRRFMEERSLAELLGITEALKQRLTRNGYPTLLALADADVTALKQIRGFGPARVMSLYQSLEETLEVIRTETGRTRHRALDDAEWEAAAPSP